MPADHWFGLGFVVYFTVIELETISFLLQNKNLPIENTTDCLSTMASVCRVMLETPWVQTAPAARIDRLCILDVACDA